jgi:rubrerythrin
LTALLNAGWQRGLTVPRVERSRQGEFVVREFETFCPKVLVGLGRLADTVEDRAIHITLQRKKPNESVCDFYLQDAREEAKPICEALERWASDPQTMAALRLARPLMPRHISDRAKEGWRLLVAIADAAGSDWSGRARKAMLALEQAREDPAFNVRLLIALRDIFVEHQAERLTTLEIAEALAELPDAPVPEEFWKWLAAPDSKRRSQQIGSWLAKALKPFGIKPAIWKENGQTQRGYRLADLQDAFDRYLPPMPTDPDDEGTAPNGRGDEAVSSVSAAEKEPKPQNPNKIRQGFKVSTVSSTMTTPAATDPLTDPKNPLIPCHLTDREVETALFTEDETDETVETASKNPSPYLSFAVSASKAVAATDETAGATDQPENLRQPCQSTTDELEVKVVCENCGAWKRIPPDAFLLTDPRCPVCGEVMRPEPEDHPPTDPADPTNPTQSDPAPLTVTDLETGETLVVGTNAWLEATFSTACPDCGTALTDGTCPTCGYPDDRPQWRIGRLVMAIAKTLRSRHPQCRRTPCEACRQVVARMNRAVVANDWQGLIALWREVTADAL